MTLADRYRAMPDERLLQIALTEADGLTPEAVDVLHAELATRGLDASVGDAVVEAQRAGLTRRDVETLAEAIRCGPCPICGRAESPVDACAVARAASVLVVTSYTTDTVVGCKGCRDVSAKQALRRSALAGWWGLPAGPFQTIRAIWTDVSALRRLDPPSPSETLLAFVEANPGLATALAQNAAARTSA